MKHNFKIRNIPIPAGLNKIKLWLMLILVVGVLIIIFIWTTNRDQNIKSLNNTSQDYNLSSDYGNIDDIVGVNKKTLLVNNTSTMSKQIITSQSQINETAMQDNIADHQMQIQNAQELKTAMKAPLSANQLSAEPTQVSSSIDNHTKDLNSITNEDSGLSKDDQSLTAEKRKFIKANQANITLASNILSGSLNNPVASLVLSMGTKIPAQLDQEINSQLPGQIYGHVNRDVFDSRTHNKLLIPAGSNLVGTYDSAIAYGQSRLLVAWNRVNFPNGQWLDIKGMGGADPVGAGFGDQVDNHYWRIFGATILTSVLAAGAQLSQPQQTNALQSPGVGQTIGQSVGNQIAATGTMLLQKNINLEPTIHIRPGFEFTIEVNKDIIFPNAYASNINKD